MTLKFDCRIQFNISSTTAIPVKNDCEEFLSTAFAMNYGFITSLRSIAVDTSPYGDKEKILIDNITTVNTLLH